ncbi:MAG: ribonuclease P protein component [Ilumatobacteraceae bacterium]
MISAIRGRGELQAATRAGHRIPGSVLWCTWLPDSEASSTSVAYAIPRGYGSAVRRNRLRRRLRALLAETDRHESLPPGVLLIGPHRHVSAELTFGEVRNDLERLIDRIRRRPTSR